MYIAVEGVIGVGKTTLVRMLHKSFEAHICLEVFEENPFLSRFYEDRERYAFQTQMFFLMSRYHQQRREIPGVLAENMSLISDYTFDKDAIFAEINIAGDELEMYHNIHRELAEKIPDPDLTVFLRAKTDTLMSRIAQRDRPYERNMERSYIALLAETYNNYFARPNQAAPVLIIDTDDLNVPNTPKDFEYIEQRIRQALHMGPYQQELPIE
jgi:deoxyguanosine kinase